MPTIRYLRPASGKSDWPKGHLSVSLYWGPLQVRAGNSQFAIWWRRKDGRFAEIVNRCYGLFANRRAS